jgi:beta-galactosidase
MPTQYEGWFYEGAGIYRHVWLNQYDNLHIPAEVYLFMLMYKIKTQAVNIETTVKNQNFSSANCTVYSYITDRDGKQLAQTKEQPLSLSVNAKGTIKQKITLKQSKIMVIRRSLIYIE